MVRDATQHDPCRNDWKSACVDSSCPLLVFSVTGPKKLNVAGERRTEGLDCRSPLLPLVLHLERQGVKALLHAGYVAPEGFDLLIDGCRQLPIPA